MPTMITNTDYELRRARQDLLGALGSIDAKRPAAWEQYGYKSDLQFADFMQAYSRGGPGHGAVHRILDACWQEPPRIKKPGADAATPWEAKVSALLTKVDAMRKFRDLDRRNMVGHYAALIYRMGDGGKALREPLDRAAALVDLVPVYEDQIRVVAWDSDQNSQNFGRPTMWQYRMRRPQSDTQGQPDMWADVHPSRIQILSEGSVGDFFDGVPLLKAGFNSLVDLEKICGGSGESFLKNSARTIVFRYDANASVQAITAADGSTQTVREAHETQTRALNRNQDSSIVLRGGDASTLQTTISDPTGAFQIAANMFAASVQIPFTVLFGQQTGRMASDEDAADMIRRCRSRQINELTPMLREFIARMQAAGLIEASEFEIWWPPLDTPGDDEKTAVLGKMTSAMQQAFQAGVTEPLFDANELRRVVGFEPRGDDGMPTEGDPGAVPDDPAGPAGTP